MEAKYNTEDQFIAVLKEAAIGAKIVDFCRKCDLCETTYYDTLILRLEYLFTDYLDLLSPIKRKSLGYPSCGPQD